MVNHGYHRSTMRRWSETAARIAATTRTSEKVATLADYLRSLTPNELPIAVTYMTGRPFPERDPRTTGIGWAAIAAAAESLVDAAPGALGASYNQSSDLGQAVSDLLESHGHEPKGKPPTLVDVDAAFSAIAAAKGQAKAKPLRELLARCDAQSAKSVVKVLSGDLRIGLREGHLENAIAKAFDRPLADVQWTGMLTGDLGLTAVYARDDKHKAEILKKEFHANAKVEIGRFKGLGEMMPAQLKETTMDPAKRTLLRVVLLADDREGTADSVERLMGTKAEARFAFISDKAEFASDDLLDV